MKKSGNLWSFAFFGFFVQTLFVLTLKAFFQVDINFAQIVLSYIAVMLLFIALRTLMDWKTFDHPIEDYARETYIGQAISDKFAFAIFGGIALFIGNPFYASLGIKSFAIGMFAANITQSFIEFIRINYNALKEKWLEKKTRQENIQIMRIYAKQKKEMIWR